MKQRAGSSERLARLPKDRKDSNKIRNKTGESITDTTEIQRIKRDTRKGYIQLQ